jgi:hypothetical protein
VSIWAKSNTRSTQNVYFRNQTAAGGTAIDVTTDWQRFSFSGSAAATIDSLQIGTRGTVNTTQSVDILIWHPQFQESLTLADYQSRVTASIITQSGIPSVRGWYFDLVDDAFTTQLDAGTYTVVLAGEKGIWIEDYVHDGGAWTYGPTTWTGGPTGGITNLIGNRLMSGSMIISRTLTAAERTQLVAYLMAQGAPGVWETGAELAQGGNFSNSAEWTIPANWAVSGGKAVATSVAAFTTLTSTLGLASALETGALYLGQFDVDAIASGGARLLGTVGTGTSWTTASTAGRARSIAVALAANTNYGLQHSSGTLSGTFDNLSIKKITLNTAP